MISILIGFSLKLPLNTFIKMLPFMNSTVAIYLFFTVDPFISIEVEINELTKKSSNPAEPVKKNNNKKSVRGKKGERLKDNQLFRIS